MWKAIAEGLRRFAAAIVQVLLRLAVLIAYRPKRIFVSEAARKALGQPCVVISNHVRGWDGSCIFTLLPRQKLTGLVAKDMVEKSRALRFFLPVLPLVPIDREHASLDWLRESRRLLKAGRSIYLCPEGKCQFDHVVRDFKPGFATLAAAAQVPVLPVYHNGEYHPIFGRRFRMIVGEPVMMAPPPEGLSGSTLEEECRRLHSAVQELELRLNGAVRQEAEENSDEVSH